MYKEYFGLREAPFSITPDPRYVYMSLRHQEALAHLLYGTGEEGGFVQLTGEVGTGKTTLVRVLLEQELGETDVALIINPRLTLQEFVATICDELGAGYPTDATTLKPLIDALNRHLLRSHAKGRQTVVIVDEAQNLVPEVLEQVRLLTNLETSKHKLLRIILVGQPELKAILDRHDMRQLAQRITARCHLDPLSRAEVSAYVAHRLEVAGGRRDIFTPAALRMVHKVTGGIPRLINVVCDRALLGAYTQSARQVEAPTVRRAAFEAFGKSRGPFGVFLSWQGAAAAVVLVALVAGSAAIWSLKPQWLPWAGPVGSAPLASAEPPADGVPTPEGAGSPAGNDSGQTQRGSGTETTADAAAEPASSGERTVTMIPGTDSVTLAMTPPSVAGAGPDEPVSATPQPSPVERSTPEDAPGNESAAVSERREYDETPGVPVGQGAEIGDPPSAVAAPRAVREPTVSPEASGLDTNTVADLIAAATHSDTQLAKVIDLRGRPESTADQSPGVIDLRGASTAGAGVIDLRGASATGATRPSLVGGNMQPPATDPQVLSFQELAQTLPKIRVSDRAMFHRLFALWGISFDATSGGNPCIEAYGRGMRCLEGQAAWHNLRNWDRPTLIWLQAGEDRAQPVLLSGLGPELAQIDLGEGPRSVPVSDLEAFWTGRIAMVWRLQSSVALIGLGSTGEPVRWVHERLNLAEGLPADAGTPPSVFDADMKERVIDYQRRHGLSADGIVGQYTMIELNNLAPEPGTPRLVR